MLLGIRSELPSIVRTLIARHESCSTRPMVSPERIMSPTWTVRSIASAMPEKRLPSVSWSARPRTAVMIAEVVSSAGRLTESSILKQEAEQQAEDEQADELPQQLGRRRAAPQAEPDVEEDEVEDANDEERAGQAHGKLAVVLRGPGIDERHPRACQDRDQSGDDGEEQQRGQQAAGRLGHARDGGAHRAAILSATARGSAESWNMRIAATPEMRSRYGSSSGRRSSEIPPIA